MQVPLLAGRDFGQALADLRTRELDRGAVEIRAARRRGRRGVGDLVGPRRHQAHEFERDAKAVGGDLRHLGVQALAHLGAAVIDLDRAVGVHEHQRARLVQEAGRERDPKAHRGDR